MTAKEILFEQFNCTYDENGWFVALKNALINLKATEADWKPAGVEHSIRETVNHLIFWNERWLKRYHNEPVNTPPEIAKTFLANEESEDFSEADWAALTEKLYTVFDEWKKILEAIDEAKLNELVSEAYGAPWSAPLTHMNIHNAYHLGQIVIVRKLQGSWDASKGIS